MFSLEDADKLCHYPDFASTGGGKVVLDSGLGVIMRVINALKSRVLPQTEHVTVMTG